MQAIRLVALGAAALASQAAFAQAPDPGAEKPRPELQAALALKGDPAAGKPAFKPCEECHGADATGRPDGTAPQLAGQLRSVLLKQMTDVRAGLRDNPKMHPVIAKWTVSPQEMANMAAYLASLPVPAANGKGDGKALERGGELYDKRCMTCHGEDGGGDAEKFYPMVAGQHYAYLLREATNIREGRRGNANQSMVRVIKRYTDADLAAVADYMSRLKPRR